MENKSKVYDIRRKSEYLNDILERTPTWIFRWGNTLFLLFIVLLVTLSSWIKYPDTIVAKVEILTENPPIEVVAKVEGAIDTIFCKDKSYVNPNDTLAFIESILRIEDIRELRVLFEVFNNVKQPRGYLNFDFPKDLELGELSDVYSLLLKDFEDFKYFLKQNNVLEKIEALENEISHLNDLNISLSKQEAFFKKDLVLTEKKYKRQKQLNENGLVSDDEKEESESIVLQQKRQLENFRTTSIENDVRIEQVKNQIRDLHSDRGEGLNSRELIIKQHLDKLTGEMKKWEEKYIIFSPISGLLSYTNVWSKDQYIRKGQPVFTVVPERQSNNVVGRCRMPLANSGKIEPGANVQIRLDAYPYQEYGVLENTINEISLIPVRNNEDEFVYDIKLIFKDTLKTTYGETIPFKQRMSGTAIIIKEKKSVLERIFDQFLNVIKN